MKLLVAGVGIAALVWGATEVSALPNFRSELRGTATAEGPQLEPKANCPRSRVTQFESGTLDPVLQRRWTTAKKAAKSAGVELTLVSGRRSAVRQQELWECALDRYGSARQAREWVLPPNESHHVQGKAIDVGPISGSRWLDRNGYKYGLCRAYDNELWHYEALTQPGTACPDRAPHA